MSDRDPETMHIGRSWAGSPLEDACLCPQQPCGLVAQNEADPDCLQHGRNHPPKTMRQGHSPDQCLERARRKVTDPVAEVERYRQTLTDLVTDCESFPEDHPASTWMTATARHLRLILAGERP